MRNPRLQSTLFLWTFVAGCAGSMPREDGSGEAAPAPFVGGVTTTNLRASGSGRMYQVSVAVPARYGDSSDRYGVLVGVDANGQFGTLVESARLLELGDQVPPLIIVGVGFAVGGYQTLSEPRRSLELTPTRVDDYPELWAAMFPDLWAPEGSGGAAAFLDFLIDDVIPFVDRNYRTTSAGRGLYGHSLGGLFGFYALLRSEGAFARFIIASPSLWWDDAAVFELEAQYAEERNDLPGRAFFSVGLEEFDELRPGIDSGRMVSNLRQLMVVLERRRYKGLSWKSHFFEGENHQSVVAPSISRGLRYVYGN